MSENTHVMHNRADHRWGHPEAIEENFYTITMESFLDAAKKTQKELESSSEQLGTAIKLVLENQEDPIYAGYEWKEYYTEKGIPEAPDMKAVRIIVGMPSDIKEGEKLPTYFVNISGILVAHKQYAEAGTALAMGMARAAVDRFVMIGYDVNKCIPAYKYPECINEAHCAYQYVIDHAEELHIDLDKFVFYGCSNGGFAALNLAFRLKKYNWLGAPMPRGLVLTVPVMDDVAVCDSQRVLYTNEDGSKAAWDAEQNQFCMKLWLGDEYGNPALDAEIVPGRATLEDLKGFPPVWFACDAEFDPSRDSMYAFASKLHQLGIFCDVHVWGACSHQAVMLANTDFGKRVRATIVGAMRDAIMFDFRRAWLNKE